MASMINAAALWNLNFYNLPILKQTAMAKEHSIRKLCPAWSSRISRWATSLSLSQGLSCLHTLESNSNTLAGGLTEPMSRLKNGFYPELTNVRDDAAAVTPIRIGTKLPTCIPQSSPCSTELQKESACKPANPLH